MGTNLRAFMTTAAALLACGALHGESGTWGGQVGLALPAGGAKQWVGTTAGASLDVTETYSLGPQDAVRMRFGYFTFKASSTLPETLTVPGWAQANYPANTTNEAYAFTYGAEYIRILPARIYVLGGLGVAYVTASRTGTFDLTNAALGPVKSNFDANNFVPYLCGGLGVQISKSVSLEIRYQGATMKAQTRKLDLGTGSLALVAFDKLAIASTTVGLTLSF